MTVSAIVFDLGNVLIDIDFDRVFQSWARSLGEPVEGVRERFKFDDSYQQHERGEISGDEYLECLRNRFQLGLSYEQFLEGWNEVFLGESKGMAELLDALRSKVQLFGLTNTNQLHHDEWKVRYASLFSRLERIFVSSELGCRKPEPEIFRAVQSKVGVTQADQILFFDDAPENIAGARTWGWRAFQTTSCAEIRAHLLEETAFLH